VIRVDGAAEVEVKERKDRVDDAMHATRGAVEEGILPGGGVALLRAVESLKRVKMTNGFDAQTGEFGNLVTKGIIDPIKVVCIALQDGASIAGLLITTEAMVAEKQKKETPGGGMDH